MKTLRFALLLVGGLGAGLLPAAAQTYTWTTLAGTPGSSGSGDSASASARFNRPQGVAVDGNGNVFVADVGNSTIRRISPEGAAPKRLLIRVVGPGLAQFGVVGALVDPQLALIPLGRSFIVASNDNWDDTAATSAAFAQAGAFALAPGSKDAALVVRLPPGGYTVVVSGAGNTTGTALVEIYDLDP